MKHFRRGVSIPRFFVYLFIAVIAPRAFAGVTWSTYLGGDVLDSGYGITVDNVGSVYITGFSNSAGWITLGPDTTYNGGTGFEGGAAAEGDVIVVKLSSTGSLIWSTYLGGSDDEIGYGIAVDALKNVYVSGGMYSTGWAAGGFDTTYNGHKSHDLNSQFGGDAFVVKLSSTGVTQWSTYLGGDDNDWAYDLVLDSTNNIYIAGRTESAGWVSGGYHTDFGSAQVNGFVAKLTNAGQHVWSTYLGGNDADWVLSMALDSTGTNVFVTGPSRSGGWVSGGYDTTQGGGTHGFGDGFAAKLTSAAGAHVWSTFLGGSGDELGYDIALDRANNVYVTGITESTGWAVGGYDTTYGGNSDGFLAKLTNAGAFVWSTYLGGSLTDYGRTLVLDKSDNIFAVGISTSEGWVSKGFDTTHNGISDAYIVMLNSSGQHILSSYLGGDSSDTAFGVAGDGGSNIFITGGTLSKTDWISGAYRNTFGGGFSDGYVAKINIPKNATDQAIWTGYP